MRRSITSTSGRSVTAGRTASRPVVGLADQLDRRAATRAGPAARRGPPGGRRRTTTRIMPAPPPRPRQHGRDPAAGRRRAGRAGAAQLGGAFRDRASGRRRAARPVRPAPSSTIDSSHRAGPRRSSSARRRARACRTTFVSASVAIRYAATSTAAGSAGSGSGASTVDRAAGRPVGVPAQRPDQAQLVQGGRAQPVDQPPDVVDAPRGCRARSSAISAARPLRVGDARSCRGVGLERRRRSAPGRGRRAGRGAAGGAPPRARRRAAPGTACSSSASAVACSATASGAASRPSTARSAAPSAPLAAAHADDQLADPVAA